MRFSAPSGAQIAMALLVTLVSGLAVWIHFSSEPLVKVRTVQCLYAPLASATCSGNYGFSTDVVAGQIMDVGAFSITNRSNTLIKILSSQGFGQRGLKVVGVYAPFKNGRFYFAGGVVRFPLIRDPRHRKYLTKGFEIDRGQTISIIVSSELSSGHHYGKLMGILIYYIANGIRYKTKYGFAAYACPIYLPGPKCQTAIAGLGG